MNLKSKLVSVFGAGIIALSMIGGAAAADNTNSVNVNVAVRTPANGTVSWSVTSGTFSDVTSSFTEVGKSKGTLTLSVTDSRFTRQGWSISMNAQDFQSTNGQKININNFTLKPNSVAATAGDSTSLPVAQPITMKTDSQKVLVAQTGTGSGSYTATMDGELTVPANTQAGTYTTTITVNGSTAP